MSIVPKKSSRGPKPSLVKPEVHVGDIVRHLRRTHHLSVRTLANKFFRAVDPPLPAIIRSNARSVVQSEWSRAKIEALGPFNQDSQLEPMVVTIQPGGKSGHKPYVRRAEQLAVVLRGTVELTLEEEMHDLKQGDAAGIPANSRHCWRNKSKRPAQILIVTAHRAL
ncbi:MAG: putative HTH-type transcriptional regulator [Nitrospira sp.]|nr:putative HTH-type transcriptional regulator [Nitrospira sp.]